MDIGDHVKVVKTPPEHATGQGSLPCKCKGKLGVVTDVHGGLVFIRFDRGGRTSMPGSCLMMAHE